MSGCLTIAKYLLVGQTGPFPCRLKLGEGYLACRARLQGRLLHCACKVVASEAQRVDTIVRDPYPLRCRYFILATGAVVAAIGDSAA